MIGDNIEIKIVDVSGSRVRIGIDAPEGIPVHRKEVYQEIVRQNVEAAEAGEEAVEALEDATEMIDDSMGKDKSDKDKEEKDRTGKPSDGDSDPKTDSNSNQGGDQNGTSD